MLIHWQWNNKLIKLKRSANKQVDTARTGVIKADTVTAKGMEAMAVAMITMLPAVAMITTAATATQQVVTPIIHTGIMVNTTTIRTTIHNIIVIRQIINKTTIKRKLNNNCVLVLRENERRVCLVDV